MALTKYQVKIRAVPIPSEPGWCVILPANRCLKAPLESQDGTLTDYQTADKMVRLINESLLFHGAEMRKVRIRAREGEPP